MEAIGSAQALLILATFGESGRPGAGFQGFQVFDILFKSVFNSVLGKSVCNV